MEPINQTVGQDKSQKEGSDIIKVLLNNDEKENDAKIEGHENNENGDEVRFMEGLDWNTKEGRNLICIMFIGLASQLDNSVASLSIQPYYQLLVDSSSGSSGENLYGLANGIYWLAQFAFAPVFGTIIDKFNSYKTVFMIGMLLQGLGNFLYAMLFYIQVHVGDGSTNIGWQLLIVSRVIQGIGSAVVVTGTTYITTNTSMRKRAAILGSYRSAQLVAASVGGALAYMFIPIPEPTENSPPVLEIFNFYTMGGWLSVIICSVTLTLCTLKFEEIPPLITLSSSIFEYVKECEQRMKQSVWFFVFACCAIQFTFFFSMLSIQTQVFNIAFAGYKAVDSQKTIWRPWIAFALGALPATYLWKLLSPRFMPKPEKVWTNIGITCGLIACVFLIPYWGVNDNIGPQALMYIAFALVGAAQVWFGVNQEIVYSKQISYMTHTDAEVGNRDGSFISIYMMTNALANFFGPFVVGFVWIPAADPALAPAECTVAGSTYDNSGCYITHYAAYIGTLVILLAVCLAFNTKFDSVLVTYPAFYSEDEEVVSADDPESASSVTPSPVPLFPAAPSNRNLDTPESLIFSRSKSITTCTDNFYNLPDLPFIPNGNQSRRASLVKSKQMRTSTSVQLNKKQASDRMGSSVAGTQRHGSVTLAEGLAEAGDVIIEKTVNTLSMTSSTVNKPE